MCHLCSTLKSHPLLSWMVCLLTLQIFYFFWIDFQPCPLHHQFSHCSLASLSLSLLTLVLIWVLLHPLLQLLSSRLWPFLDDHLLTEAAEHGAPLPYFQHEITII